MLKSFRSDNILVGKLTDRDYLKMALSSKMKGTYSEKYKKMLQYMYDSLIKVMSNDSLTKQDVKECLDSYSSGVSHNTIRRHLNVLINEAISLGMSHNPMEKIKSRKSNAKLHKPFKDIALILDEVKSFNENLYMLSSNLWMFIETSSRDTRAYLGRLLRGFIINSSLRFKEQIREE